MQQSARSWEGRLQMEVVIYFCNIQVGSGIIPLHFKINLKNATDVPQAMRWTWTDTCQTWVAEVRQKNAKRGGGEGEV